MRRASLAVLLVVLSAGACMSSGSGRSMAALTRRQFTDDARQAIEQERTLGAVPGPPTTVAVLPLRFSGSDSSLRPLERGFAELLTTDLSRSSKLTVVERARIQTLLDELALQQSGRTDASTNVRAGRLLRAGRVVQGSIFQVGGSQLRVDAAVLDVPTTEVRGTARGEDEIDRLFDLEKRIALGLFDPHRRRAQRDRAATDALARGVPRLQSWSDGRRRRPVRRREPVLPRRDPYRPGVRRGAAAQSRRNPDQQSAPASRRCGA